MDKRAVGYVLCGIIIGYLLAGRPATAQSMSDPQNRIAKSLDEISITLKEIKSKMK